MKISSTQILQSVAVALMFVALWACGGGSDQKAGQGTSLSGAVRVDGSSTVFPITEAVAEEFRAVAPQVRVTVGVSGTGGGFKKFTIGETDISDASRPIKPSELEAASAKGIGFIELPIAYDGLSIVVHKENTFVDSLTVADLKKIWEPESSVHTWADVRAGWPAEEIRLFAPGTDSGTFDYFTEAINGKSGAMRVDFTASEDDNVIVQGVAGDRNALGFFGFAYYEENKTVLRAVPIDSGSGPIMPQVNSINDGTYAPLSRPIFIYVSKTAAARPEVDAFVKFYLNNVKELAREVGYVALPDSIYAALNERYAQRVTGSAYTDGSQGGSLEERYLH